MSLFEHCKGKSKYMKKQTKKNKQKKGLLRVI